MDIFDFSFYNLTLIFFPSFRKIQIFDILGIEVMSVGTGLDLSTQRIDVSGLPSGVYYIKIGDRVEKFVKM